MQKIETNYQDLLKAIAIIAMIIDHFGLFFFPEENIMRIIGRYAMPIFCFFAGYNFKGNIRINILIYGIILHLIALFFVFKFYIPANILVTIFIGLVCLKCLGKYFKDFWQGYTLVLLAACLGLYTDFLFDYGSCAISIIFLGHMTRQHPNLKYYYTFAAALISFFYTYFAFYEFFDQTERILSFIVACACFISLSCISYDKKIPINLSIIRRYLLEIYCLQELLIQLVWVYYFKFM